MIDTDAVKSIPMPEVLRSFGVEVDKYNRFLAIWRGEERPSARIKLDPSTGVETWYDFATKERGTNIDLVMRAKGCSYPEALRYLQDIKGGVPAIRSASPNQNFILSVPKKRVVNASWMIIEHGQLSSFEADLWTHRRLTPGDLEAVNCEAVRIKHSVDRDKKIWCIGHKNALGGYAVFQAAPSKKRKKSFKAVISPSFCSWIPGRDKRGLIIAESVFDTIAALKLYDIAFDAVSLNSVNHAERTADRLLKRSKQYQEIILALDNDEAGRKAADYLRAALEPIAGIIDDMPLEYKDPCDEWKAMDHPTCATCQFFNADRGTCDDTGQATEANRAACDVHMTAN